MNVIFAWAIGATEIILVLAVVLILFGAKKIPELAKGLGTGIKEFKKATKEVTDEVQKAADEPPAQQNKLPDVGQSPTAPPASTVSQISNPPKV
ncbi:MAG: twin-arginine translocase TatA/TatE family subunit [Verrucomicrobiota bacterium]|jgi:sec-independent protein translocase protein TatA